MPVTQFCCVNSLFLPKLFCYEVPIYCPNQHLSTKSMKKTGEPNEHKQEDFTINDK